MISKFLGRYYALLDIFCEKLWNLSFSSRPSTKVLMYHEVSDEYPTDSCHHTVDEFRNTLERFEKQGIAFIPIENLFAAHPGHQSIDKCVISFDDVPESFYKNAYPILKDKGIPFTLFLSQKYIGQEGFLSISQVRELSKDPLCTIGAHTISHCMLRKTNNSKDEMLQSKQQLESLLNKEVKYLAYPYGKHSSVSCKIRKQAQECGFDAAFGTIDAPITSFTLLYRYYLPRMVVR